MRLRTRLVVAIVPLMAVTSALAGGLLLGGATEAVRRLHLANLRLETEAILAQCAYENSVVERLGLGDSVFYIQSAQRKVLEYLGSSAHGATLVEVLDGAGYLVSSSRRQAGQPAGASWDPSPFEESLPRGLALRGEAGPRLGYVRRFAPWDWRLLVSMPALLPRNEAAAALFPALLVLAAGVAAAGLLARRLARGISLPVERLVAVTGLMGAGDLAARADPGTGGEIGELAASFNAMAARLQEAAGGLEETVRRRTEELSRSLEELRLAQDELVRKQKLAALGSLVAGVAHEVNTPLGVSVTAASYVQELTEGLRLEFQGGALGKKALGDYVAAVEESSRAISANLARARVILSSFKELAVDQQADERRSFDLASYLGDILETLRPAARHRPVAIELRAPAGIQVDGRPAALAQVVANLVINSLRHAFPADRQGKIEIEASLAGDRILLEYADDGVGMDAATAARAFEPFFTTRRGEGGSGLGLAIVENAVTSALGGSISLETAPGAGVRFHVQFPRIAPVQVEGSAVPARS